MHTDFAEIQRQVRIACAPAPGEKGAVKRECPDCGASHWDWERKWRHRCAACSAERARVERGSYARRARV